MPPGVPGPLARASRRLVGAAAIASASAAVIVLAGGLACDSSSRVQGPANHPPQPVTLLEPDSAAAGVPLDPTLSWTGGEDADGDSVVFEIHLGAAEPLPQVAATGDTVYKVQPGLDPETEYFWQVVARDDRGATTASPTWAFTTGANSAPSAPADPNPADGAADIDPAVVVSWGGGVDPDGHPVTFDVYFGTSDPPPLVGNQAEASYDPPGDLEILTTYYWQSVAKDDHGGETAGPVWSFSTAAAPNSPPSEPSSPAPPDGATDVLRDVILSWSGGIDPDGDPVTFDVYFGTSNPPGFVRNQSGTTYNPPGMLAYETPYFWRIVAKDDRGGETSGPVWDFTTLAAPNNPPSAPSNPDPADGAVGVSRAVVLSWSGGVDPDGDPVTFDVYFGTTDPPPLVGNQSASSYDPPGDLDPATGYFWQIVAKDDRGGSAAGPTWSFTTGL